MERGCYCGLWETSPVPYTGAGCDRCHAIAGWLHPARWVQVAVVAVLILPAWCAAR